MSGALWLKKKKKRLKWCFQSDLRHLDTDSALRLWIDLNRLWSERWIISAWSVLVTWMDMTLLKTPCHDHCSHHYSTHHSHTIATAMHQHLHSTPSHTHIHTTHYYHHQRSSTTASPSTTHGRYYSLSPLQTSSVRQDTDTSHPVNALRKLPVQVNKCDGDEKERQPIHHDEYQLLDAKNFSWEI